MPLLIHARDESDRPRSNQADEELVDVVVWQIFEIEVHRLMVKGKSTE
jgi:hypothetical protein